MFSENTPLRLHGCNGKTAKDSDGERRRVLLLTFMAQPFTPEIADDFNVKGRLFSSRDAQPLPEIQGAQLKISIPLQRMLLSTAPDVAASVIVDAVDVQPVLKVNADREGPVYTAYFSVELDYPTADQLLWLFHKVTEQVFVTFEAAQGDMLAKTGTMKTRLKKTVQPALEEEEVEV